MAAAAAVSISGQVSGGPSGAKNLVGSVVSQAAVMNIATAALNGDVTIGAPAGMTGVIITPLPTNAVALKLKGNAADTGILLHKTNPTLICLDPSVGSIIVNAASLTGLVEFNWF